MRTRRSGTLKILRQVSRLTPIFKDKMGNPLFEDLEDEIYVAKKYRTRDLDLLCLKNLSMTDALKRIGADLKSPVSKMKDPNTDDD
jgi:hypothetical protein